MILLIREVANIHHATKQYYSGRIRFLRPRIPKRLRTTSHDLLATQPDDLSTGEETATVPDHPPAEAAVEAALVKEGAVVATEEADTIIAPNPPPPPPNNNPRHHAPPPQV